MTNTNTYEGGAATTLSPAQYKTEFHKKVNPMRLACEKANNWDTIRPLLNDLVGSFDIFIESLD